MNLHRTPALRTVWTLPCSHTITGAPAAPRSVHAPPPLVMSALDRERLIELAHTREPRGTHWTAVLSLLNRAIAVPPHRVPEDLVTMNSIAWVQDVASGASEAAELVYPDVADERPLGRSITAPLGAALFCARIGGRVVWQAATRRREAVIIALQYQPEREHHYHL